LTDEKQVDLSWELANGKARTYLVGPRIENIRTVVGKNSGRRQFRSQLGTIRLQPITLRIDPAELGVTIEIGTRPVGIEDSLAILYLFKATATTALAELFPFDRTGGYL